MFNKKMFNEKMFEGEKVNSKKTTIGVAGFDVSIKTDSIILFKKINKSLPLMAKPHTTE